MNRPDSSEPAGRHSVRWPLLALLTLLVLAACTPNREATITSFDAQPLQNGDGSWRLEWEVTGTSDVALNGEPIRGAARASQDMIPAEPTTYTLTAGGASRSLTIAPVSTVEINVSGPVFVAGQLQFTATVQADGTGTEPSQAVRWESSDDVVFELAADGTGAARQQGPVTIRAVSLQDEDVSAELNLDFTEAPVAVVDEFSLLSDLTDVYAGDAVEVSWAASEAIRAELVEIVTEGAERTVTELPGLTGTLELNLPTDKREVNYVLRATNVVGVTADSEPLFAAALPLPGWVCSDPDDVITFADPLVESYVRRDIYLLPETGDILCGDVQGDPDRFTPLPDPNNTDSELLEMHHALIVNRCDQGEDPDPLIVSLEGVQHLIYLRRLELECNELQNADLRWLSGLTYLEELNLDRNHDISDLSSLAGLTQLRVLGLYANDVEDLTPLSGLSNLSILYLSENRVKDLTPIAGLIGLRHVWLYLNCEVIEYNQDPEDAYVTRWADCLQDLSPLAGLADLETVVFHMNEVSSLEFLNSSMTSLQLLNASANRITDLSPLQQLPALETTRLDGNLIRSLEPLAANTQFPASTEPFGFSRGTVNMPPPTGQFADHLSLHYNCLDTADAEVAADHELIVDRGALTAGFAVAQLEQDACSVTVASTGRASERAYPEAYLRELSSYRHHD